MGDWEGVSDGEARTYQAGALRLPLAQLKEAWAQNVQD